MHAAESSRAAWSYDSALSAARMHAACMQLIDTVTHALWLPYLVLDLILSLGISLADVICVSLTYLYSAVHVCLTYTRPIEVSRGVVACTPGTAVCARDALGIFLAPVRTRTDLPYCTYGSVRFWEPVLVGFSRTSRVCLGLPVACGPLGMPITGLPIPGTRAYTLTRS